MTNEDLDLHPKGKARGVQSGEETEKELHRLKRPGRDPRHIFVRVERVDSPPKPRKKKYPPKPEDPLLVSKRTCIRKLVAFAQRLRNEMAKLEAKLKRVETAIAVLIGRVTPDELRAKAEEKK